MKLSQKKLICFYESFNLEDVIIKNFVTLYTFNICRRLMKRVLTIACPMQFL